ncbi:hypothetical protein D3C77_558510 [compost metagenome]
MQADTEHQQHHADFRQLRGQFDIGDETRRGRAEQNAGEQVANQCRELQLLGDEAEDQGQAEPPGKGGDKRDVMFHQDSCVWATGGRQPVSVDVTD